MSSAGESSSTRPRRLEGKVALVTGGAVRIGAALSVALAREGASVIIHHNRSHDAADRLRREIEAAGGTALLLQADFADPDQVHGLMAEAERLAGRVDILVNNASTYPQEDWTHTPHALLDHTLHVNTWAPLTLTRALHDRAHEGACVVNVLDTHLHAITTDKFPYQVSKHALWFLTRYAALACAPRIRVNAILPGAILPPPDGDEAYLDRLGANLPLRRHGAPQDVADALLYLATSPFVTGVAIEVDGGEHLLGHARA